MRASSRYGAVIGGILLFSTAALAQSPDHLTDRQGRAVYVLAGGAACDADCALLWPPVPARAFRAAAGADAGLVGALALPDGTREATYAGKPLRYFAEDVAAGDTNGHRFREFGKVGYLVALSGREVGGRVTTADYADDDACGCGDAPATLQSRFAIAFAAPERPALSSQVIRAAAEDRS